MFALSFVFQLRLPVYARVVERAGMKGTGRWTVQEAAERSTAAPTMAAALDARYMSGRKAERVEAAKILKGPSAFPKVPKEQLVEDMKAALYCSKICSYAQVCVFPSTSEVLRIHRLPRPSSGSCLRLCKLTLSRVRCYLSTPISFFFLCVRSLVRPPLIHKQSTRQGMNLIKSASEHFDWNVDLGECARIWKGGCIIRAAFLDDIKRAYVRNPNLDNLLVDPDFAAQLMERQASWRRVVTLCVASGIAAPAMTASLSYFDAYRRARLPANLVQVSCAFCFGCW